MIDSFVFNTTFSYISATSWHVLLLDIRIVLIDDMYVRHWPLKNAKKKTFIILLVM